MSVLLKIEDGDQPGSSLVHIGGELTVQHAAELRTCLLHALSGAQSVQIDLQAVEDVDLTCLQILCSAHKSALFAGKTLCLGNETPQHIRDSLDIAGFSRLQGCTMDAGDSCLWLQRS
jgi:anti-anti-sigma factor